MDRYTRKTISVAATLLLALHALPVRAADGPVAQIPVAGDTSPNAAICYVIGDVQFPGAFEFQVSPLTISTLIKRAGGLDTAGEDCVIKIVRSGQVVHHADYQAARYARHCRLRPGDIVIATAKSSKFPTASPQENPQSASKAKTSPIADIKHVALVGIRETAVILPMYHQHATVSDLLTELGQPASVANRVGIITGSDRPAQRPVGQALRTLSNGMVLVFNPRDVNRARLPRIPAIAAMPDPAIAQIQLASHEQPEAMSGPQLVPQPEAAPEPLENLQALVPDPIVDESAAAELLVADQSSADEESLSAVPVVNSVADADVGGANRWTPIVGALLLVIGLLWMLRDHRQSVSRLVVRLPGRNLLARAAHKVPVLMTIRATVTGGAPTSKPAASPERNAAMNRAGKLVHRVLFRVNRAQD